MSEEYFSFITKDNNIFSDLIRAEDIVSSILYRKNKIIKFADEIKLAESKKYGANFIVKNNKTYMIRFRYSLLEKNIMVNKSELVITQSNDNNIYSDNYRDIIVFGYSNNYQLLKNINQLSFLLLFDQYLFS